MSDDAPRRGSASGSPIETAPAASVAVHIGSVVLEGFEFTAAQGAVLQRALEHELLELFERNPPRGAQWQAGTDAVALAPSLKIAATPSPTQLGRELARSVFAALGRRS